MPQRNVFTIEPGAPFLDTLVEGLLDGSLVGPFDRGDPIALADVTLYLPTRRAARAIRDSFLDALGRPVLLPRIRTLGDIDEDEDFPDDLDRADIPAAIPAIERQLVLANLVLAWSQALVAGAGEAPPVSASAANAVRLAHALGRLIDQVGTSPAAWARLFREIPGDLARYWQMTLEFLTIATQAWPAHLAERGLLDPGVRRDLMIRAEAERLARNGSPSPVIAAGSTGSVPATAALLAAIAGLANGAVVLPGLDVSLDAATWNLIGPRDDEPAGAGHPQFGLKKLIEALGITRQDVVLLGQAPAALRLRNRFVTEALRPAATTERWRETPLSAEQRAEAVSDIAIIEAANEREEALAIALVLRRAAEDGAIAALVTPDRTLARRVAVELKRWEIEVDDFAGQPLSLAPPGVLARLVAEVALGGARAEPLLALLKHPLAAFGMDAAAARRAARSLERAVLRGPRLRPGLDAVRHALRALAAEREAPPVAGERRYPRQAAQGLSDGRWRAALFLADRLCEGLHPLESLAEQRTVPLLALLEAHAQAVASAGIDTTGGSAVFAGEAGEALARTFEELVEAASAGPTISPLHYPDVFAALVERQIVRPRGGLDPRIHIWGALEARLQSVDVAVLGSLNEGTWPSQTRLDPLLSRPMRAALDLDPPERRIGLAAHDFAQALGHRRVWLTRAARQDGEPRVGSRWLQRLTAYAGAPLSNAMKARGEDVLGLARRLDEAGHVDPPRRPRPAPPVAARPRELPATQIETLIRDPYAVHARYVLRLRPFEAIAKTPDAAERGTLIHDILEAFIRERPAGPYDELALQRLLAIARVEFDLKADFPEIASLWWPRFERIARWFVTAEAARDDIVSRTVEGQGRLTLPDGFVLSARADRLDRLASGGIAIVDYKTGTPPSPDEVLALSPQLPLEAFIAMRGGFPGIAAADVERLDYYHLSGRNEGGAVCPRGFRSGVAKKADVTLADCIALTEARLLELLAHYGRPEAEYLSRKIPKQGRAYAGEYDHLARVAEWTIAEPADAELF